MESDKTWTWNILERISYEEMGVGLRDAAGDAVRSTKDENIGLLEIQCKKIYVS